MNRPRSLAELLNSGGIERLAREARRRRALAAEIRALLPAEEALHLVSADVDDTGCLILGMDSAAWAARVRYGKLELAGRRLKVKVVPRVDGAQR
ncbi:DciA family protein [Candidatus Rariloculus sp.]|uniref:DciA family protein n=1 Tax=Candidatus Rariloculus sp. TaxID=3101265 RepID=UPI003D0BA4DD